MARPDTLEASLLADAATLAGAGAYWPARWSLPSENALPANPVGSIALPAAVSAWTAILQYEVPKGFRFVLEYHWHFYAGTAAFIEGSGALLFALYVNPSGTQRGRAVADFGNMRTTRGSPAAGPWPLRTPIVFEQGSFLSYEVRNASQATDASTFVSAGLHGRLEPNDCGTGVVAGGCMR